MINLPITRCVICGKISDFNNMPSGISIICKHATISSYSYRIFRWKICGAEYKIESNFTCCKTKIYNNCNQDLLCNQQIF